MRVFLIKSINGGKLCKIAPFIYLMIPFIFYIQQLTCSIDSNIVEFLNDRTNCFQDFSTNISNTVSDDNSSKVKYRTKFIV